MLFFVVEKNRTSTHIPLSPRTPVLHNVNDGRVMQTGQIVCIGRATLTSTTPRLQARSERSRSAERIYENTVRTLGFFLISKRFRIYSVDSQIIYAYLWKSAASVHYFHRYYLLNHKIGYVERNCSHLNRIFTFSSENNSSEQLCDFILKSTLSSPDGTFS